MDSSKRLLADGWPEGSAAMIGDGPMGTMLLGRGYGADGCLEALSLTHGEVIGALHDGYLAAGAQLIKTHTFGANAVRLGRTGRVDQVEAINRRAVELAREAANGRALVAGSIGPLGVREGEIAPAEARAHFRQQAAALAAAGVDLFFLESFSALVELEQCHRACREAAGVPVAAHVTLRSNGRTPLGIPAEEVAQALHEWGADFIGVNCCEGPESALLGLQRMRSVTDRPLSAFPSAGLPTEVEGRLEYSVTPGEMGQFATRAVAVGARIVGACCGATAQHVQAMAEALASPPDESGAMPLN